ncbi:DUF4287 domain-containing protein [Microbacterium sp. JB110]|uniref:DUF4287 domain-containing protein n=1 Tax=Microbacterium sp. JB110 TaxID=2024477 RepID=UPI001C697F93|nr:DUF4287 domain-containing protein [Microbacterium sp. JB110]
MEHRTVGDAVCRARVGDGVAEHGVMMTTQESFKKRIRARMAKTGERYSAARRALIEQTQGPAAWVSQPEASEEAIRKSTGHGWDEWVALVDAGPGRDAGHTAIATWVRDEHGVGSWWAQSVTVGYERITGIRLPGEMTDGTFTVSRTRVLDLDAADFRAALLDDARRGELIPDVATTLRSKSTAKSLRFDAAHDDEPVGIVAFALDPAKDRVRLTVTHEKLPTPDDGELWKARWADWLAGLG